MSTTLSDKSVLLVATSRAAAQGVSLEQFVTNISEGAGHPSKKAKRMGQRAAVKSSVPICLRKHIGESYAKA